MHTKNKIVLLFFIVLLIPYQSIGQCAMCRAALQTEESGIPAEAVNDGIVYLMAIPYLLLIFVSWGIYKVMRNKKKIK